MSKNQVVAGVEERGKTRLAFALVLALAFVIWAYPANAATSEESAAAIASLNAGTAAIQSGRALEAIDYFNTAIESNALSAEGAALAYHHRGIAHQKLGLAGHAIADYTNAIWKGGLPEVVLPRSYYNRAVAHAQMGQQDRAERDYDKAIELAPTYAAAYHNRANLRRHTGNLSAAIDDYTRALQLGMGPQEHLSYFGRALAYNALGNKASSLDDTARALELKPDFGAARKALAEWSSEPNAQIAAAASNDPTITGSIVTPGQPTPVIAAPVASMASAEQPDPWREERRETPVASQVRQAQPAQPAASSNATIPAPGRAARSSPRVAPGNLDAVRIPTAGLSAQAPVALTAPDVAAIEPQSGSVTVTPLAQALPPARASEGWQTTVTRFAQPVASAQRPSNRRAAVPAETGLTTASIDRNANLPTSRQAALTPPRANARGASSFNQPIRVAENNGTSTTDAGGSGIGRRVQVGSFRSAAEATSAWDRIANAHRELIGQKQPYIVEADLGARGTFYRLQIGPLGSANEVKTLCRALKLRGQDCIPAL